MATNQETKNITILQLTRIGDILQTSQACLNIKKSHPNVKLQLVARKEFGSGLLFHLETIFDDVVLLDPKSIFDDKTSLEKTRLNLRSFLGKINAFSPDITINLSFTKTSAYLNSLINAKFKLGMKMSPSSEIIIDDTWSQYLYATVMTGPLNCFSLVDIFRNIIGAPEIDIPKKTSSKNIITIHPFASLEKKMWKKEKWSELIFKILKGDPDVTIKIVGAENEIEKANAILDTPLLKSVSDRAHNLVGKTSIKELFSIVKESRLFVGHDSMVGHIASFVGTQSISISLGCVRPLETTPWGENNIVLYPRTKCFPCFPKDACDTLKCHSDITHQVVYEVTKEVYKTGDISKEHLTKSLSCFHLDSVKIMKSKIVNGRYFNLVDVLDSYPNLQELMRTFYRINWLYCIEETEEAISFPSLTLETSAELRKYLKGLQHTFELAEFGKKYSKFILSELAKPSPSVDDIKDFSLKIDEVDKMMDLVKDTYPALDPLVSFYKLKRHNIQGENVVELSEYSYLAYEDQTNSCGILFEMIEKSLAEYDHKSLSSSSV